MTDRSTMYFVLLNAGEGYGNRPRAVCCHFNSIIDAAAFELEQEITSEGDLGEALRSDWRVVDSKIVPQKGRGRKQVIDACCKVLARNGRQYNAWPVLLFHADALFVEAARKAGIEAEARTVVARLNSNSKPAHTDYRWQNAG